MTTINENFLKLQKNYLFADIAQKVAAYKEAHPEANIIRLGIGDVTRPRHRCSIIIRDPRTVWAAIPSIIPTA